MADRVHPAVHGVQAPAADPKLDGALTDAEVAQLGAADHPVLGLGENRYRAVGAGWAGFGSVVIPNSAQGVHDPILTHRW